MKKTIKDILGDILNSSSKAQSGPSFEVEQPSVRPVDPPDAEPDPCVEIASDCKATCREAHPIDSLADCHTDVGNPFDEDAFGPGTPNWENFCVWREDMCDCEIKEKKQKCERRRCENECRDDANCPLEDPDNPNPYCNGDCNSCEGRGTYCDGNDICIHGPSDNKDAHRKWCKELKEAVIRAMKEHEKALGDKFYNCITAAGGPRVTPQNKTKICNCRKEYIRKLKRIQIQRCEILRAAGCPTRNDSERAYAACMGEFNNGWIEGCPGMNPVEGCLPKPRPRGWNGTKTACVELGPGGGGFGPNPGGGGGRRPPRIEASEDRLSEALKKSVDQVSAVSDPDPGLDYLRVGPDPTGDDPWWKKRCRECHTLIEKKFKCMDEPTGSLGGWRSCYKNCGLESPPKGECEKLYGPMLRGPDPVDPDWHPDDVGDKCIWANAISKCHNKTQTWCWGHVWGSELWGCNCKLEDLCLDNDKGKRCRKCIKENKDYEYYKENAGCDVDHLCNCVKKIAFDKDVESCRHHLTTYRCCRTNEGFWQGPKPRDENIEIMH